VVRDPAVFSVILTLAGCATVGDEMLARVSSYRAEESRRFVARLAETKVDPREADVVATVTSGAFETLLAKLDRSEFPVGSYVFAPLEPPQVELHTGSALLRIVGELRSNDGGTRAGVELVAGLATRWNEDGAHVFLKPTALAVIPTTGVGFFDFAMGSAVRSFAEVQAAKYLEERVGELDVPVQLLVPFKRPEVDLLKQHALDAEPPTFRYVLPESTVQLKLRQLYLWLLEGRLVVLAFADVVKETAVPSLSEGGAP